MNKYAGFLLLDIVVDIDGMLLNNRYSKKTINNIEDIKYFLKILSEFITATALLDDGEIDEKEFNNKINKIMEKHRKAI